MLNQVRTIAILLPLVLSTGTTAVAATRLVSISLNTDSATLHVNQAKTFQAKLVNLTTVTWQVNKIPGGNHTVGTIDKEGRYAAPEKVPSPNVISIDAVSVADPLKKASASVTLLQAEPSIHSLGVAQINTEREFTVKLAGVNFSSNAEVSFSDQTQVKVISRSSTEITIQGTSHSASGTKIRVMVTNPAPGKTASEAKTLEVAPAVAVEVSPKTKVMRGLTSMKFNAAVHNATAKTVTWLVNGVAGGNATLGTINEEGTYSAPAVIPVSVTISAKSTEDKTKTDSAQVTLQNPIPGIAAATSPVTAGAKVSITINGTGFAPSVQATLGNAGMTVKWINSSQINVSGIVEAPVGGMAALIVRNPNPGAAASNTFAIAVKNSGNALSYAAARRFLEHATWGPTANSIAHLQSIGINAWLAEQFSMPVSTYNLPVDTTSSLSTLQEQFFQNALSGQDQLRQRLAFALSQITVVSGSKLTLYYQMMPYQQMLLNDAFGTYHSLLTDVTLSPGMGHYLDMVNNNVPSGTQSADENYARELMQLFTIGLTPLNADGSKAAAGAATYSEDDVRALARVMTGWTYAGCFATSKWTNAPCFQSPMVAFEDHHDQTSKHFLGVNIQTGSAAGDLEMALQSIEQYRSSQSNVPNIAPFISVRLIQHLVTSNPAPDYVSRVSQVFMQSGGDLRQTVTAVLTDTAAGNDGAALAPDQGHLTEPVLYTVGLLRALGAKALYSPPLSGSTMAMGQNLFNSPSVFNYYLPSYTLPGTATIAPEFQILSQSTAFYRANFAYRAVHNQINANIAVDLTNIAQLAADTNAATESASMTAMLNTVSQALLGAPMTQDMLAAIMPAVTATKDAGTRARNAVFLVAASSQYQVQR